MLTVEALFALGDRLDEGYSNHMNEAEAQVNAGRLTDHREAESRVLGKLGA